MKNSFIDKLKYKFDNMMSQGTIAQVRILFFVTFLFVSISGFILFLLGDGTMAQYIWVSIMHVIDPGTITGDETHNIPFLILMSIVTLCGIFITSILISIITTGFKERLDTLKRGNSRVIEKNHTLILGYSESVHTIIQELINSNSLKYSKDCVVILANEDMEVIKTELAKKVVNLNKIRVICRTGEISDVHMLKQCSIDTAKSIIINSKDDFTTTKTLLAINSYFKEDIQSKITAHAVAPVFTFANYDAICIAGSDYVEPILIEDTISRIIAQTCRQPGLSNVLIQLFSYADDELYFKNFKNLAGKKFSEILNLFDKAIVFGIYRDNKTILAPKFDTVLRKTDELILLAENSDITTPNNKSNPVPTTKEIISTEKLSQSPECILILGINDMLQSILCELDNYFIEGSKIIIADEFVDTKDLSFAKDLKNIDVESVCCDINKKSVLDELLKTHIDHVLLLSDNNCDDSTSDSMTLLKLVHLRDIYDKENKTFNITSEMKNVINQKLAQIARVNDLVIGSNIINLISTQISQNRALSYIFKELLSANGAEIYIRKSSHYIKPNIETDFYTITEIAKSYGEIAVGYKIRFDDTYKIITNPLKSSKIMLTPEDSIIVLSDN